MIDGQVFFLTLENVATLLLFIALGYLLRRSKVLPDNAGRTLSLLTAMVFTPAYSISSLSKNFTPDTLGDKAILLLTATVVILVCTLLANLLSRLLGRTDFERRSLTYAFIIPNYGYFGYPTVEGVFGPAMKADMIVYCIPISLLTNTYGYLLFSKEKKISWKRALLSPPVLGVLIGSIIGLSGWKLPTFLDGALTKAGNCMSPASMILAGFVLGSRSLKSMLSDWRAYAYCAVRMLAIPLVFGTAMILLGIRDTNLLISLVFLSMPLGLNLVVFPESYGIDAQDNANMCFVSYLMALLVLPVTFGLIQTLAQLP